MALDDAHPARVNKNIRTYSECMVPPIIFILEFLDESASPVALQSQLPLIATIPNRDGLTPKCRWTSVHWHKPKLMGHLERAQRLVTITFLALGWTISKFKARNSPATEPGECRC